MKKTNEKGITLISLIITIIVIIILLGVTELVISDDLFGKADNAEKYTVAAINDVHNDIENIKNQPTINDVIITDDENEITVTSEVDNITQTSARITATAKDKKGERLTYRLFIKETDKKYGPTISDTDCASWDVTGLTPETTYTYTVTVVDEEDKNGWDDGDFTTLALPNNSPEIIRNELNDKTTSSFTIDINATDADNDDLTYKIYIRSDEDSRYLTYTLVKTIESMAQNTPIQLTIEGLNEYTLYYWYITAEDGNVATMSDEKSVRTYCPGGTPCELATYCAVSTTSKTKCDDCKYEECDLPLTVVLNGADYAESEYNTSCGWCEKSVSIYQVSVLVCSKHELYYEWICGDCWNAYYKQEYNSLNCPYSKRKSCTKCEDGYIYKTTCPDHSCTPGHYYCATHKYNSASSQTHILKCSHNRTDPHDD